MLQKFLRIGMLVLVTWSCFSYSLRAQSIADWRHVLSRTGRVVDLRDRALVQLPEWQLDPSVEVLLLDGNKFSDFPEVIAQRCPNLRVLSMQDNTIFRLSGSIGRLPFLQELYLDGNEIPQLPPQMSNLRNLRVLSLSRNALVSLSFVVEDFKLLEILRVDGNRITNVPPEIGDLVRLVEFTAAKNRITSITSFISRCEFLQVLDLAGNSDLYQLPDDLRYCTYLRYIDVGETQITEVPAWAGDLPDLEYFVLQEGSGE